MTHLNPKSGLRRFALPIAAAAVFVFFATRAESAGKFVSRVYKDSAGEHKYVVFVPAEYLSNETKKWPIILYLHGAGDRGTDGVRPSLGVRTLRRRT